MKRLFSRAIFPRPRRTLSGNTEPVGFAGLHSIIAFVLSVILSLIACRSSLKPSSSIVVKVDFDLTLSLLAHNLYRRLASHLNGFEKCTVPTIYRNVLENGANIKIINTEVVVRLKKKTHLPILFQLPWLQKKTHLSWMGLNIKFEAGATS